MAAKYAVCPGPVLSKNDSDVHFITAPQLMQLYGVDPRECVVIMPDTEPHVIRLRTNAQTKFLRPRYDGNYTLPK